MFDLFGRKRIVELEQANANLNRRLSEWEDQWKERNSESTALRNQVEYLVRTIRQMDDQIFAMSQCTDWNAMRPYFLHLSDAMTARKVAESNRIGDIMRQELIDTYTPRPINAQKKITST